MDLALSDEQLAVRGAFAAVLAKEASPKRVREVEAMGFDPQLWSTVHGMGAIDVGVPLESGGGGGGLLELALIAEEVGRRIAPIPFASSAAAARVCVEVGAGDLVTSILEGSRLVSMTTRRSAFSRQLLADGAVADVVLALEGDRLVANYRPAGIQATPNMGGLPAARWEPDHQEILADGPDAVRAYERGCDAVRLLRAAELVGLAAEAIEIGASYARERRAFGTPIGTFQAVAHPLADAVTANDGAQLLVYKAAWALDGGRPEGPGLAVMALVFTAEVSYAAAQHSLHIHGGYGFTEEYDIQLYYRRAKAWVVAVGDPNRELLTLADRLFGPVE
jgi:alkylation response protein AidB-like acyl-CoA dehydrogenase